MFERAPADGASGLSERLGGRHLKRQKCSRTLSRDYGVALVAENDEWSATHHLLESFARNQQANFCPAGLTMQPVFAPKRKTREHNKDGQADNSDDKSCDHDHRRKFNA